MEILPKLLGPMLLSFGSFLYAQTAESIGSAAVGIGGGVAAIAVTLGILVRTFASDRSAYEQLTAEREENARLRAQAAEYAELAQNLIEAQRRAEQLREQRDQAEDRIAELMLRVAHLEGAQE